MAMELDRRGRDPFRKYDPPSNDMNLYKLCLTEVLKKFRTHNIRIGQFPVCIAYDLICLLHNKDEHSTINAGLSTVAEFRRFLKLTVHRSKLHEIFQALHQAGWEPSTDLRKDYVNLVDRIPSSASDDEIYALVDTGIELGVFLNEAAWYEQSILIFKRAKELLARITPCDRQKLKLMELCYHLLKAQSFYCDLKGGLVTVNEILPLIEELKIVGQLPNLCGIYTAFSNYYFARNEFTEAYDFAMASLIELKEDLPAKCKVDSLRQASRSCVIKRQFERARLLIKQAVDLAFHAFGHDHPKYADVQLDFGFFLLNYDTVQDGVRAYENAYRIRRRIFSLKNLNIAAILEDLAYALYVHEYSSGRFTNAQNYADQSIKIMQKLLPKDHIMLSSAQRVKALILEEVAIDSAEPSGDQALLKEAEQLHLGALKLGIEHFGERNVQTAKHYGNLGRLYQSMKLFEQAEEMHKKAIEIKEELLGPDDYEVGLSLGHLASLYNYHMERYVDAIELYTRSIKISVGLFGKSYSGLEYDYRGLIHVYTSMNNPQKVAETTMVLDAWRRLRTYRQRRADIKPEQPQPLEALISRVMSNGPEVAAKSDSRFVYTTVDEHLPVMMCGES